MPGETMRRSYARSPPRARRTTFLVVSTVVASSFTICTPYLRSPSRLRVRSLSDLLPPRTRFESGHEMNALSRSTITTSIAGSHIRTYFAAVAPPKPPPITTTRALDGVVVAHPATEIAPAILRKSRRFMAASLLLRSEVVGDQLDLRVGIALRELVHDGRGALAVLECLHLVDQKALRQAGKRDDFLGCAPAVRAMTVGASGSQAACRAVVLGERDERHRCGDEEQGSHRTSMEKGRKKRPLLVPLAPSQATGAASSSKSSLIFSSDR